MQCKAKTPQFVRQTDHFQNSEQFENWLGCRGDRFECLRDRLAWIRDRLVYLQDRTVGKTRYLEAFFQETSALLIVTEISCLMKCVRDRLCQVQVKCNIR